MRSRRLESLGGPAAVAPLAFSSSGRRRVTSVRTETRRAYRVVAPSVSRALGWPPPTRSPRPRRPGGAPASRRPRPSASLANPGAPPPVASTSNRCVPAYRAGARRRPFRPTRLAAAANDTDDSLSHYYPGCRGPPTLTSLYAVPRSSRDVGPSYSADDAARELEHLGASRPRLPRRHGSRRPGVVDAKATI